MSTPICNCPNCSAADPCPCLYHSALHCPCGQCRRAREELDAARREARDAAHRAELAAGLAAVGRRHRPAAGADDVGPEKPAPPADTPPRRDPWLVAAALSLLGSVALLAGACLWLGRLDWRDAAVMAGGLATARAIWPRKKGGL